MSMLVPFPQPPRLAISTSETAGAPPSPTCNTIPKKGGNVSLLVPKFRWLFVSRIPRACLPLFDPSSLPHPAQPWEGRVASFPGATRTSRLRGEHRMEALLFERKKENRCSAGNQHGPIDAFHTLMSDFVFGLPVIQSKCLLPSANKSIK